MHDRIERVSHALKKEISVILQEETNDPRIKHVTITEVEVTKDLKLAKVYYTVSDDETERETVLKGLTSASGFIRAELAERIEMKYIPRISFREDTTRKETAEMDRLFEKIEEELGLPRGEEEGREDER